MSFLIGEITYRIGEDFYHDGASKKKWEENFASDLKNN